MKYLVNNKFFLIFTLIVFLIPQLVFGQGGISDAIDRAVNTAYTAGYEGGEPLGPYTTAELIIEIILGFLGLFFFIQILIAGYQWLSSGGNEDKINHARDRIKSAAIGILIVLLAYLLTVFVINQLVNATD